MNQQQKQTETGDPGPVFDLQLEHQWQVKRSSAEERIATLNRLKSAIRARETDIKNALHSDLRKSDSAAGLEISLTYTDIDDAIDNLTEWMQPVKIETSAQFAGASAWLSYEARGIVLLFGPWNFPFNLVFQPLVPIIAAGNCAIVKPNEMAPETSKVTTQIIRDVFEPAEVAVFEGGIALANQLLELPVHHIFFTGSPAVGKIVMAAAAKHLASVTLELGGKNPVIVDRTADITDAATKIAAIRNMNSGQVCLCPEEIWVAEEHKDEFLAVAEATYQAMFYQDGALNTEEQGKIVDLRNFERVKGYIDDAREKGATVVCGGETDQEGLSIHPTLLTDVPAQSRIRSEETFGPILSVFTYKHIDEVVDAIQKQPKPLALYLFTQSDEFVQDMLQRTSSGGVTVNDCAMHAMEHHLPFGGVNNSGIGRYHGIHGFKELSHERAVLALPVAPP
jgi:aldehyde dehydrogenase (NAD+)